MSSDRYKLLRTDLPVDVWNALAEEAEQHGMKIGVYVKTLLTKHVGMEPVPDHPVTVSTPATRGEIPPVLTVVPAPPTKAQWEALNKWLLATGRNPDPSLGINTKSGLMAWAIEQGFQKP